MKIISYSLLLLLSSFILSSCTLFPKKDLSQDASTTTPSAITQESDLPTTLPSNDPDQDSLNQVQTDAELLLLLENLEEPSFDSDLDTMESSL